VTARARATLAAGVLVAAIGAAGCIGAASSKASRVEARDVSFTSGGYRLVGTLTTSADGPIRAGVLIISGSGPIDRDGRSSAVPSLPPAYRLWADRLGDAGFAVLRYDKRFITHPNVDFGVFDEDAQIADAHAATERLRSLQALDGKKIFIIGHSEGGTLAPLVAGRARAIAGVVVINSVLFPVDELLVEQLSADPTVPKKTVPEVATLLAKIKDGSFPRGGLLLGAGADYWAQWIRYSTDAPATLVKLPMPVLIVQCLNDETLPGPTLQRNLSILRDVAARHRRADVREIPGHDHSGFARGERTLSPRFIDPIVTWLTERARAAD
jgi:pimeloyl-ACP methyl ester carboxylesterase